MTQLHVYYHFLKMSGHCRTFWLKTTQTNLNPALNCVPEFSVFIMATILAFTNQKGGVGKTTSAVNVALSMAVSEVRTLLIDLDPQSNATTGLSALFEKTNGSIYDVLIKGDGIKDAITKTSFSHLDIVSSTNDLVGAEIELVSIMAREYQLMKVLKDIKKSYEIIIIDCPPSLGLLTINALTASDALVIPIQCEYFALEGLGQLLNTVRLVQRHLNKKLGIAGIIMTMYDSRLNLSKQVVKEVNGFFKDKLFKTFIHRNVRLSEAPSFGKPALLYDANSTGARNYMSLTEEILQRVS
jgi:chromosome partitioning protein|tara:strand:+ start:668 stop:1561 length:894 start_codon:yes stop_codon:yes gene_type:complete